MFNTLLSPNADTLIMEKSPAYFPLNDDDRFILESNLDVKYNDLLKMAFVILLGTILAYFREIIRDGDTSPGILILVCAFIYALFFSIYWFGTISRLRKDLAMQQKVTFETLVKDKAQSSTIGIDEHYLLVDTNIYHIKKIDVTPRIYEQVNVGVRLKVTVAPRSGTFLECQVL